MINECRLPMSESENMTVHNLMREYEGESVSLTRRDPNESGPVLAQIGDMTWEIDESGLKKKAD